MAARAVRTPTRSRRSAAKRGRPAGSNRRTATARKGSATRPTGRSASARTAAAARPARRAPARRRGITPPGGVVMLPVAAVGGAAGAVGGMADSGFMVGITRGRLWIALLGVLLGGIVAVNVWGLSLRASTSAVSVKVEELERANSVQRARIAKRSSTERVQSGVAAELGLGVPSADAVRWVKYKPTTARRAARRLASGELTVLSGMVAPEFADAARAAVAAPAEPAPIEPAPIEPLIPAVPATEDAVVGEGTEAVPPSTEPAPVQPVEPAPQSPSTPAVPPAGGIAP